MSHFVGPVYLASLFYLVAVVVSVYSASQDVWAPMPQILRQAGRRTAKLLGVLAVLAVAVTVFSKI